MINIVAIALLISSLAAAGIFSPPLPNSGDPPPLREGHRLIVVEYELEIPSNHPPPPSTTHRIVEDAKEKLHEASSVLPNLGQGISTPEIDSGSPQPAHSAKELITGAFQKAKETAKTAVENAEDAAEKITGVFRNGKEETSRKASELEEGAKRLIEKASEMKENIEDAAEKGARDTTEKISFALRKGKEKIEEEAKIAAETAKDAVESAARDVGRNLSRFSAEVIGRMKKSVADFDTAGTGRLVAWVVHLVGFSVAYGASTWVTFVSSHVLAAGLPRQQFGVVQSKVYPVYFRVVACGVGAALAGHWFGRGTGLARRWEGVEKVEGYNLVVALGLVLVNMWYFEPRATKVMFERMKLEKEEGKGRDMADDGFRNEPMLTPASTATATRPPTTPGGPMRTTVTADQEAVVKSRVAKLSKKLKKLNTYSSFLNLLELMSLTWHLVHLARRLQMTY